MRFALGGAVVVLEVGRAEGLALLEWLGLGRGEFGAVEVRAVLPLCRRRLWREARNDGPLRVLVERLTRSVEASPDAILHFG